MTKQGHRTAGSILLGATYLAILNGEVQAQFMTGKRIFDEQHREARNSLRAEEFVEKVGFDQRLGQFLPLETEWRDSAGERRRLGEFFRDRPVLLAFGYYRCPVLCPLLVDGLASALKPLALEPGKDFELVFVSIDPEDLPESAARYQERAVARFGRGKGETGWHFLVGNAASIAALTDAAGFRFVKDDASGEYAHAAGLVITAPDGRISRYLYGVDFAPRDVRFAVLEASASRIGTVTDRILLLCFEYNESLGRYTAATFLWLRLGGVLTVVGLLSAIAAMLWRERRTRQLQGASVA